MAVPYPTIDPVAIHLGPLPIRWYSLAYIGGLAAGWFYLTRLLKKTRLWPAGKAPIDRAQLDDVIFWVAIGVIAGGRLGYLFFYEPHLLIEPWPALGADMDPGLLKTLIGWLPIPPALMLWKGGMSFHGGLIGVGLAGYFFARKYKVDALSLGDLFACAAPIGLFFGRIANFINAELYGRPWDGPWAMVFPSDPDGLARHPSQLYEAALEGVVLFIVIRIATHYLGFLKRPGATTGLFLAGYAVSRILVENFREPDIQMPDFPLGLTMGMILSTPMLALGLWLIWRTRTKSTTTTSRSP
jgi:phosphatidylglycerol:prolipoprotein diacylglycerol transferase